MADVVGSVTSRREISRSKRRRDDRWIGITALVAAMSALPLATGSWHGPEVAAILAVSATALLAGQRWAVAIIVIAEMLLLPTVWPRAFLADGGDLAARIAPFAAVVMVVPGLLAIRRAAAALVLVTGRRRTQATCRRFQAAIIATGVVAVALPLVF